MYGFSDAFEYHRHALPAADTKADQGIPAAAALQLSRRSERETRAGGPQRVADRNRAAVRIYALVVERDAKPLEARQHLRRKCLVDFDDIHVVDAEARPRECFLRSRDRADTHNVRPHAGGG